MTKSKAAKPAAAKSSGAKPRQPDVTRRNILNAALYEFAAKGLAGARVDEIAERSGSNKRMIYEYFGNKEGLWLTVLERAYERMREEEHAIDVARMSPVEGMRYLMEFNFKFCSRNPEFIALLNAENLHKASFLKNSKKIRELYTPLLVVITDLLQRGQKDGVFRKGVDPVELYTTIAALGFFYFSNIHTLSTIFGRNLLSPKQQKIRLDHSIEVVLGYLRP